MGLGGGSGVDVWLRHLISSRDGVMVRGGHVSGWCLCVRCVGSDTALLDEDGALSLSQMRKAEEKVRLEWSFRSYIDFKVGQEQIESSLQ